MPTSSELAAALRAHLPEKEWALFFEVRNAAGFHANASADAIAMNLWPSRGMEIHGFELKVNRNDWIRELKRPEKAEDTSCYCDRWHVVAPTGIVPAVELPTGWGLLEFGDRPRGRGPGLTIRRPADLRKPRPKLTRDFLVVMLKRAQEGIKRPGAEELAAEFQRGRADGISSQQHAVDVAKDDLERERANIRKFEEASGLRINPWGNPAELGRSFVQWQKAVSKIKELQGLRSQVKIVADAIDSNIAMVASMLESLELMPK